MKTQAIKYFALDVHKATTGASLREASGSVVMRATTPTEAGAIIRLVRSAWKAELGPDGAGIGDVSEARFSLITRAPAR